tara:strand:+ start:257 stop:1441 length:1185 start_codon:yes stop_codon:yes gene_type:complete
MANNSATGNSYVPTTNSVVYAPRVGHHVYNGSAWVNEGVLHESEARTNLVTYSNYFTDAAWAKIATTVTDDSLLGPDGLISASDILHTGSSGSLTETITITADAVVTFSVYLSQGSTGAHDWVKVQARDAALANGFEGYFNISTGAKGTLQVFGTGTTALAYTMEDVGNGIYRCSITGTLASGITACQFKLINVVSDNTNTRELTNSVGYYGAQLEAGSTLSSYIPTSGSTATRAAETLTVPAANLPYSSTNMSVQIDGKMTYSDNSQIAEVQFWRWVLNTQNYMEARLRTASTRTGEFQVVQESLNVQDFVTGPTNTYSEGILVPYNIATRHGSTFLNGAIQGTALTANTTPVSLPDLSATNLSLAPTYMGTIGKFRVWNEDLTDAGITEAST